MEQSRWLFHWKIWCLSWMTRKWGDVWAEFWRTNMKDKCEGGEGTFKKRKFAIWKTEKQYSIWCIQGTSSRSMVWRDKQMRGRRGVWLMVGTSAIEVSRDKSQSSCLMIKKAYSRGCRWYQQLRVGWGRRVYRKSEGAGRGRKQNPERTLS